MRLFIAIELPDDVRAALGRAQDRLRRELRENVSWVKPQNLHLTMKFLGEVPDERVPALVDALRGVPTSGALRLHTAGAAVMPPHGPGRVLVEDVAGDVDRLTNLAKSIDEACAAVGFQRASRRFRAHLTLGRLRPPRRVASELFAKAAATTDAEFTAREFVLMQSQLHPNGSIYTRAATLPL